MFSSSDRSGLGSRSMSMRQKREEEEKRKREEAQKLEDERQRRGTMPKGDRMAGDAINAANESGIDLSLIHISEPTRPY